MEANANRIEVFFFETEWAIYRLERRRSKLFETQNIWLKIEEFTDFLKFRALL